MTFNLKNNSREKELRVNSRIRTAEVRLVYDDGTQEVLPIKVALDKAREANLDLVEISPNVNPPVCKLLDYGKYKFQREKKQKESKKKQKIIKLKEVRMQPKINTHDLNFKVKHIIEFLADGNKVKITIRFRGRELAYTQIGHDILNNVLESLEGNYILESAPKMEGKFMYMIVAPKK